MRERGQISFHIERSEIFHNVHKHIISRFAWQNISLIFTARQYAFISVTHYTLQGKACEKEYEQIVRTPFFLFREVKPALW